MDDDEKRATLAETRKAYVQTDHGREVTMRAIKRYHQSDKGKAACKRAVQKYLSTEHGKLAHREANRRYKERKAALAALASVPNLEPMTVEVEDNIITPDEEQGSI